MYCERSDELVYNVLNARSESVAFSYLASDEALDIEDRLLGVDGGLVLGSISYKTLRISEGNVRRGDTVSLIVRDDLDAAVLEDTDAGVSGAEIYERSDGLV